MLVEFRVKNFRSFRDEAIISLVASKDTHCQSTHVVNVPIRGIPGLLRNAAIYGANASGKSNLIRGIQLMRLMVGESAALQPEQKLNLQPFALDPISQASPVELEVTFLKDGIRYQYGFSATADRVFEEWLVVYRSSKPQTWFRREYLKSEDRENYKFGANLQGQRHVWQQSTRPNALFLSVAVQLNSAQLKPVFDWISALVVIENGGAPLIDHTVQYMLKNPGHQLSRFLRAADMAIEDIDLEKRTIFGTTIKLDLALGRVEHEGSGPQEVSVPLFRHEATAGSATFELQDESEGTQRLFAFAGPLFEILRNGRVMFVDELDRSLHTLLVRRLVQMFHDPAINTGGAQLVFTTHDTSLLSADIFRRDQIWFTEKDKDQASQVFSLNDFSARKNEAFERGYLTGRYGGIPLLDSFEVAGSAEKH